MNMNTIAYWGNSKGGWKYINIGGELNFNLMVFSYCKEEII